MPRTPHWFTRRRERRYAKRQERLERDYFQRRRAQETLTPEVSPNAYQHTSGFWFWAGIGGGGGMTKDEAANLRDRRKQEQPQFEWVVHRRAADDWAVLRRPGRSRIARSGRSRGAGISRLA